MADPYAEFGGSTVQDPYAEFGGSMTMPELTAQHMPIPLMQPVPSHGPEPGGGWLSRGLEAGGQREVQTVQGQARALYQQPTLGMGMDTGTPEEIRQNITGPVPHWSSAALSRLKAGDPLGAAVAFAMDNSDKIKQLPDWAQNIILGKKIPESIGQGAIDVWNQVGAMAYGGAHPIDAVPATEAAVRGAARGAEAARQGMPAVGASAGAWMGGKMGSAAGGPGAVVGGAVGAYLGKRAGEALRDVLPPVPGTEFGLPPAIDWSAFERTEPPSGPLGPPPPPPPPPGGGGGGPPLATPEQLAAIRQQFEDIRARGQEAPAAETPAEAPAAAPTGDQIAREYGYDNEADAIAKVGRGAWQMTKAQGRAAGRPVGAPPPVTEPSAVARPAPAYNEGDERQFQPVEQQDPREQQRVAAEAQLARGAAPERAGEPSYAYTKRSGGDVEGLRVLSVPVRESWSLNPETAATLKASGYQSPDLHELDYNHPDAAQTFHDQVEQTKAGNRFAASVHVYTPEEYAGARLFLTGDGKAGFALKPDGDIVSVFVHGDGPRGAVHTMLEIAKQAGGTKLDAFDTVLPEIYGKHGFTAVSRTPWNDEYTPEGWDKKTFAKFNGGEPDVVFMARNPQAVPYQAGDGVRTASYDNAVRLQQEAVNRFAATPAEPPAAAPAPESTFTQQLRASLAQEPAAEPARDPQVVQAIHDAADKLDDAGMLQTFRAQQEYERQVTELEKGRAYLAAQGMEHGTKQMLAAAAGEAPPETWTKLPNWTVADEQRIDAMLASHEIKVSEGELQPVTQRGQALLDQMQRENAQTAANRAAAEARVAQPYGTPQFSPESEGYGAQNKFITQERYDLAKQRLREKLGGMHMGFDPTAIPDLMQIGAYHIEAGLRNFGAWSQQMLQEAGDRVQPYLQPMWSRLTEGLDSAQRISQRVPTGKLAFEDPTTDVLQAGREAVDADPGSLKPRLAAALRNADIPGLKLTAKMSDDQVLDAYTKHAADNLEWLYKQVPEDVRKLTMQWYDGARTLATQLAEKRGLSNQQVAGVLASLSPSTDWYMNVSLAKRVIDTYLNQQDTMTTPDMLKLARERGMAGEAKALRGKTLGELGTNEEKGWWVRLYDEAHAPNQNYDIIAPDGSTVGPWRTQKGQGPPGKLIWQSNDNIMKAIAILDDGSRENIQAQLSKGYHKVPSFFNNIIAPNDPAGDVTVDTHAVAAAQLRPLGSGHPDVTANFSGPASAHTGSTGTYPLNADAYRIAAERLGIQPRQFQSVIWEAARDLFPDPFKTKQGKLVANGLSGGTIDGVWRDYQSGKISINKARQQIVKIAAPNGFPKSYWQQFLK